MSRIGKVAKNSMILGLQHVVANLLSVFVVGYIARKLGKVDYGVFSFAFTFTVIFSFIGDFGLRTLTIREVAKEREHSSEYLSKVIPARLFLIALMTAVSPLAAIILHYDAKIVGIVAIAALAAMFEQLSRIINDIFQAHEEMGKVAFRDISVRVFSGLVSIAVLYYGYGLVAVGWVYVIGTIMGLAINIILYNKRFQWPKIQIDYAFIWKNIQEGLSFMILGMASTMYASIDVFIISKLLNMESVGVYNASASLFYRLNIIADAVATASFPAIAQLYWQEKQVADNVLTKSLCGIFVISIPTAVGGYILSGDIIAMIYGGDYEGSSIVFQILIVSLPLMFLSIQLNYALGAIRLQNKLLKFMLTLLFIKIIANFILVSIFGLVGSALATFSTELIGFCFLIYFSKIYFEFVGLLKSLTIVIIPLLAMIATVLYVKKFGPIIAIGSGVVSYCVTLFLCGGKKYILILRK